MSWFRLDDKFHSNAKVMAAGNAAVGLYARCGTWTADHGKEGLIPTYVANAYGTKREIATLVTTRLWVQVDEGYMMPDYLDFNLSNDEVEDRRTKRSEAGRQGGIKSGQVRKQRSNGEANASASAEANVNDSGTESNPDPTRPDPTPSATSTQTDRQTDTVGLSVVDEALALYAKHEHERDPDGCRTTPKKRIAAIARKAGVERFDAIRGYLSVRPDASVAELLANVFELDEMAIWRLTGQARKGA